MNFDGAIIKKFDVEPRVIEVTKTQYHGFSIVCYVWYCEVWIGAENRFRKIIEKKFKIVPDKEDKPYPVDEQQYNYITKSREDEGYKELLVLTNKFFNKELGIFIKDLAFLMPPSTYEMNAGTMYQIPWNHKAVGFVTIFVDANTIYKDTFIEWIGDNKSIISKHLNPLSNLDRYIDLDLVHVMFSKKDFIDLILKENAGN